MHHLAKQFAAATVFTLLFNANVAHAAPANIFSDHMVLQRDQAVPVWGFADAAATVTVQFAGQTLKTTADKNGRWQVKLQPMKANATGRELTIQSGEQRTVINDVLVGEVWFASGQSNMAYTAGEMAKQLPVGKALVDAAKFPAIRFRKINDKHAPKPKDDLTHSDSWQICTPQTAARHTAVGFVFARRLHKELNVPIGIIDTSWGGTPIEPYIPLEAFKGHPTLEQLGAFAKLGGDEAMAGVKSMERGGTFARSEKWLAGAIYNGRIAPVKPYAIAGAIWYQGESNCGSREDPRDYQHKMRALIKGWRQAWQRNDLPVYYVQLPQWHSYAWTFMRLEQRRAMGLPHTGMVVTVDLDFANNIHPPNKIDVGERLARWPLAKQYKRDIAFSGPLFKSVEFKDDRAIVTFDHTDGGLMIGKVNGVGDITEAKDTQLWGFEVAGKDRVWRYTPAKIEGNKVILDIRRLPASIAVRYACYTAMPKHHPWNLYNKAGLPASPFCSDMKLMRYDLKQNPLPE